jgi:hypothetical protein
MPLMEFEPRTSAEERPQVYALDLAATGTGKKCSYMPNIQYIFVFIVGPHITSLQ